MAELKQFLPQPVGFETRAIHSEQTPINTAFGALNTPIVMSSTFTMPEPDKIPNMTEGYFYGRLANPTRDGLTHTLAALDNGRYAYAFGSGMGAISTVISMLQAGDHLICGEDVYGGTNALIRNLLPTMGIESDFVDTTNLCQVAKKLKKNTKMLYLETPSNPLMLVSDIKSLAKMAHDFGDVIVVVDNTFLTAYFQRPLELGADVVVYSLTKGMNGHSDVIMGAAITDRDDLNGRLFFLSIILGCIPSPFDCFLVTRSLKTLAIRMERHATNSLEIAKYLESHPLVEKVKHPALSSHPQQNVAISQSYGHSGVFSFYIKGDLEASKTLLSSLKVITLAVSLGGFETLIEIPACATHKPVPEEQRIQLGITDNLIRISVGLETVSDLIADLDQAFKQISPK